MMWGKETALGATIEETCFLLFAPAVSRETSCVLLYKAASHSAEPSTSFPTAPGTQCSWCCSRGGSFPTACSKALRPPLPPRAHFPIPAPLKEQDRALAKPVGPVRCSSLLGPADGRVSEAAFSSPSALPHAAQGAVRATFLMPDQTQPAYSRGVRTGSSLRSIPNQDILHF